jgi:hypothetical protein
MPLYHVFINPTTKDPSGHTMEWFATALARLHAETFLTDANAVRVEFRFLEREYHVRIVSYANHSSPGCLCTSY